ncbi:probable methyltransferase TARBP1 [Prorops nasuta]|uniref:probable methyltransferase TARBP1 n=1 Tax=Prorops nasuta TaxID=863751 RepID=UPI0034CF44B7
MDLHRRFSENLALDLSIFTSVCKMESNMVLSHLVESFNTEIVLADSGIVDKLKTLRMILYSEYRSKYSSINKGINLSQCSTINNMNIFISRLFNIVKRKKYLENEQIAILNDVIILQLMLFYNDLQFKQCFLTLITTTDITDGLNESIEVYIKKSEYFLDVLRLKNFIKISLDQNILNDLKEICLNYIAVWLENKGQINWKLFSSILPKMIDAFDSKTVILFIWNLIFEKLNCLGDLLGALSIMVDTCILNESSKSNDLYYEMYERKELWELILNGMSSNIQLHRKQSLFLLKRISDFLNKIIQEDKTSKDEYKKYPFVCNGKNEWSIKSIKIKFFLVIEILEEKPTHLILPTMCYIPDLLKGSENHSSCGGNCFNIKWILCILKKMMKHSSEAIVKLGISYSCKLESNAFNAEFLNIFLKALNNTFLYESTTDDSPEIVKELTELLYRETLADAEMTNKFINGISQIAWGPIALFYVLLALEKVCCELKNDITWSFCEVKSVKKIVSTNLIIHSYPIRIASQCLMLNIISYCLKSITDYRSFTNLLLEFPSNEAMTCNSSPYCAIANQLKVLTKPSTSQDFIIKEIQNYQYDKIHAGSNARMSPSAFALVIHLLYDSYHIQKPNKFVDKLFFEFRLTIDSVLNNIDQRPYGNIPVIFDTIELLACLMKQKYSSKYEEFRNLAYPYIDSILKFYTIIRCHIVTKAYPELFCPKKILNYLNVIEVFFTTLNEATPLFNSLEAKNKIYTQCEHLLNNDIHIDNVEYHLLCCLHLLHLYEKIFSVNILKFTKYQSFIHKKLSLVLSSSGSCNYKIVSSCCMYYARILYLSLNQQGISKSTDQLKLFTYLEDLLAYGGEEIVPIISGILKTVIIEDKLENECDKLKLKNLLSHCWKETFSMGKNKYFWKSIKVLSKILINSKLNVVLVNDEGLINEFLQKFLDESERTPRLKLILLKVIIREEIKEYSSCFKKLLLSCLLHVELIRRDKRIENQTISYISEKFQSTNFGDEQIHLQCSIDKLIKLHSTIALTAIVINNKSFTSDLFLSILEELLRDKNKRYYMDSYLHLKKTRLMEILLLIQPVLMEEDCLKLQGVLCELLLLESNQYNVRLLQQWLLTRIYLYNEKWIHYQFMNFFQRCIKTRISCAVGAASMTYHLATTLKSEYQVHFIESILPLIAQCCMASNHNVRLYNQFVLLELNKLFKDITKRKCEKYDVICLAAVSNLEENNFNDHSSVKCDFYLNHFQVLSDYNYETIFFQIPRLTGMGKDQWLEPESFERLLYYVPSNLNVDIIKILKADHNCALKDLTISKRLKNDTGMPNPLNYPEKETLNSFHDVQKKIDPWKFENLDSAKHTSDNNENDGIILVASLINRQPNLGGLVRTCEVFGVKQMIMHDLNVIKNKEFQSLSMTAENWVPLIQVKTHELLNYLRKKQVEGWALIGIEQTVNSTNLLNMKFPKKTILVLGNEKDGIPANLIPVFDICVEVPQIGLIRSLNVHVTGALCIWQYCSQHKFI